MEDEIISILREYISRNDTSSVITFRVTNPKVSLKDLQWETYEMAFQLMSDLPIPLSQFIAQKFVCKHLDFISSEFIQTNGPDRNIMRMIPNGKGDNNITNSPNGKGYQAPLECPPPPSSNPRKLYYDTLKVSEFISHNMKGFISDEIMKNDSSIRDYLQFVKNGECKFSVHGIKGTRRKMEDRHVTVQDLGLLFPERKDLYGYSFYGVFDGHMGVDCANYAAVHLLPGLVEDSAFPNDIPGCFTRTFAILDSELKWKYDNENLRSGCTAVCAIVCDELVQIAWAGDSLAGVVEVDRVNVLTQPHNPQNEDEYKRIEKDGGVLVSIQGELRVNGCLNVSRSLGDIMCKPAISSVPEILCLNEGVSNLALVLACDGVWDSLDAQQMHETIKICISQHSVKSCGKLSNALVSAAKSNGSSDNITALVIYLQPPNKLWQMLAC